MHGVDPLLWCHAMEHAASIWNTTPRKKYAKLEGVDGHTPQEVCRNLPAGSDANRRARFRIFGCECFFLIQPVTKQSKLGAKYNRGVHLGFSPENQAYLVGYWTMEGRQWRWATVQTVDVKFREEKLVNRIDLLKGVPQTPASKLFTSDDTGK